MLSQCHRTFFSAMKWHILCLIGSFIFRLFSWNMDRNYFNNLCTASSICCPSLFVVLWFVSWFLELVSVGLSYGRFFAYDNFSSQESS